MSSEQYKWDYPSTWLFEFVDTLAAEGRIAELKNVINSLVGQLDEDSIQDAFQADMELDGYFDEVCS